MDSLSALKYLIKSLRLKKISLKAAHLYAKLFPHQIISRNGINYAVDLNQLVDFGTFLGGWESTTINFLNRSITRGDVIIEVGANVGAHTLLMAKLTGTEGHIYAFEPTDFALNKLRKNISLNPTIQNITIRTELVTNGDKNLPKLDIRSSWVIDGQNVIPTTTIKDPKAISIDDFVLEIDLSRLMLMKVDVDGYDFKVLQGAKSTISRFQPTIFCELCEYALNEQGDSIKDIFSMLTTMGYHVYLEDRTKVEEVAEIIKLVGSKTSINGVFIHKSKHLKSWTRNTTP